jgi:threonine synthase
VRRMGSVSAPNEEENIMEFVKHLVCVECGRTYEANPDATVCPICGIAGILDVVYDYDLIASRWQRKEIDANRNQSLWRFMPFIPVDPATPRPTLRTGGTPLINAPRAAAALGIRQLWLKDEGNNPTGSLKDRASAIGVVKAYEAGADVIACSSTGNAASSLAGHAAAIGMKTAIFVPHYAALGKIAQLLMFGANVFSVQGSYQQAYALCEAAVTKYGWYNRNCAVNPYLVEGKKTAGMEVAQQMGWDSPDWVVVSTGDGCTIAGIHKGFEDLYKVGWIKRIPKFLSVQAEGSRGIYEFDRTGVLEETTENTIADGIAVGLPRNGRKAIRAVRESGGTFLLVTDDDIRDGMRWLGRLTGVFGEPAAGAAVAGLRKAVLDGIIAANESVVCMVTGNGLKDVKNAIEAAGTPAKIEPTLEALGAALPADLA